MSTEYTRTRSDDLERSTKRRVHIYIDNSNIYIQGAKSYSSDPNQSPVSDLSWRYNVSALRDVLCNNSGLELDQNVEPEVDTTLYGSVPPPGDIWGAIENQNVTVHIFDRSQVTGKEKQVDTKMSVDITKRAVRDQLGGTRSEFIIVTGDGDLIPAIEVIIESDYRAHVWSWSNSFSSAYQTLLSENSQQVYMHDLDKFRKSFCYHKPQGHYIPCAYGKYCFDHINCSFRHSQEEMAYFKENNGPKPLRKTWQCKYGMNCNRINNCPWYHNESDRICLTCDRAGQRHGKVGSPEWKQAHGSN